MGRVREAAGNSGRTSSGPTRVRLWLAAGAGLACVAVVVTIAISSGEHQQPAQARQYLNVTACLLTDSSGIAPGAPGATAWRAMQSASLATHVRVSYLPVIAPATPSVMLGTLMERNCGVIIITGAPAAVVVKAARSDRHQEFVVVAASGTADPQGVRNLVVVSPGGAPAGIDQAVRALAAQAQPLGT